MLVKLQFLFQMEYDLKSEALEIKRLMDIRAEEEAENERARREVDTPSDIG